MSLNTERLNKTMSKFLTIATLIVFATALIVMPASSEEEELKAAYEYELYIIDLKDWEGYVDYNKYQGRYEKLYEVYFIDKSTSKYDINYRSWDIDNDEWTSSNKETFSHIFTDSEVNENDGKIKFTLTVSDTNKNYATTTGHVYFTEAASWGNFVAYTLTPTPTSTPTPVPTMATPKPTAIAPTPIPTPAASHELSIPGLSPELTKLQDTFKAYILLLKTMVGKA